MKLILLSLVLLLGGIALAFSMVIRLLPPSYALSFLAYAVSLCGLVLGTSVVFQEASFRTRERG